MFVAYSTPGPSIRRAPRFVEIVRQVGAVAKITMLEGARKQVFHVLMLFAATLIAIATSLGIFDHNVQIDVVKDLCMVAIFLSSSLIAITLSVSGVPSEIENRTVYPVIARPMARWQFIVGKYAGTMGAVTIGMAILLAAVAGILKVCAGHVDKGLFLVVPFLLIEAGLMAAVGLLFSTFSASALAWFLSLFLFGIGNMKYGICSFLERPGRSVFAKGIGFLLYQALPNLECFNFKDSIAHNIPVSPAYLLQTFLYGALYTAFLLTLASLSFGRREL